MGLQVQLISFSDKKKERCTVERTIYALNCVATGSSTTQDSYTSRPCLAILLSREKTYRRTSLVKFMHAISTYSTGVNIVTPRQPPLCRMNCGNLFTLKYSFRNLFNEASNFQMKCNSLFNFYMEDH